MPTYSQCFAALSEQSLNAGENAKDAEISEKLLKIATHADNSRLACDAGEVPYGGAPWSEPLNYLIGEFQAISGLTFAEPK